MSHYQSNRAAFRKGFTAQVSARVKTACVYLANVVRADISQPGTLRRHPVGKKGKALKGQKTVYNFTHSRPGNPPYKQTGGLRRSIAYEVVSGGLVGRVGSNIRKPAYPLYLELGTKRMKARPFLRRNLILHRGTIARILTARLAPGSLPAVVSNQARSGRFGRGAAAAGWS